MDCSTPGPPVPHHLPEFAQVHVHEICDAIQPSHPLSPSSPAPSLSQHQGVFPMSRLFTSGSQSNGASALASVLPMSSGLISFRTDWFDLLDVQGILKSSKEYLI